MAAVSEKIAGGLLGLLVGDALGVPYEFHDAHEIPPFAQIEFEPPSGFRSSYPKIAPGTWSDDGAQALCLLASLLECDRLDITDLGTRLLNWYRHGYMAVNGNVFDVGIHTARVLNAIDEGLPILEAGMLGKQAKGNGSLMRSLPLVLWHQGSDEELVEAAHLQSQVTHGQVTCQVCCALYCLWARRVLQESEDPWESAIATLRKIYSEHSLLQVDLEQPLHLFDLEETIQPDNPPLATGSGYVVDCLWSAKLAMQEESYEAVVKRAIALGNDTDTTACVAGGIAGIKYGVQGIPERWLTQLRGQELLQPLLRQLLQNYG